MKNYTKLVFLALIMLCLNANAQEYYANVTFEVQNEGITTISGTTNYPYFSPQETQELTFKTGKFWTFAIDTNDLFSEYSYKLILPKNAQIQKIETNSTYFLGTQNESIIVEGYGEKIDFNLKINYIIIQKDTENQLIPIVIGGLILIIIIFFGITQFKKQKSVTITGKKEEVTQTFDKDTLTERQLAIVEQIEKKGGKNTQSEIQKTLKLPKASLFRNISTLEKKGIVKKERKGMTMLLTLQKKRKN
jgi:uncharacterized membrane protein